LTAPAPLRALLDVAVSGALLDDAHRFSAPVNAFIATPRVRIATGPITENGVTRVMSFPSHGRRGGLPIHAGRLELQQACTELDHAVWPDEVSLRDDGRVAFSRVQGHNQVTNMYLLALAVSRGGCLATFDQGVALSSVRGALPHRLRLS
jgi:uncharacterized protein